MILCAGLLLGLSLSTLAEDQDGFLRLEYRNPELIVDLGVGLWAWPLPMDYDDDGDYDLVVACPDKPFNGTYLFENPGGKKLPVFKAPKKIERGDRNIRVSFWKGKPIVTRRGISYPNFRQQGFKQGQVLKVPGQIHPKGRKLRAQQWGHVDYDGDGDLDLYIAIGDWTQYGWDDAYNDQGRWTNGPLHGYLYISINKGTDQNPNYQKVFQIKTPSGPIDVFGWPSPCFADYDGDGDLDLILGEFKDRLTYFENTGGVQSPKYSDGKFLLNSKGEVFRMPLCMIVPVALDWDRDGDTDLVVGQEDGRVALLEHLGAMKEGRPQFSEPQFFKQQAQYLKFGALSTPYSFDWDEDGDEDLIAGNTAGEIAYFENLDGGNPPRWAAPRLISAGGKEIRIQAGYNGSIQGPAEEKWGYTTLSIADWDQDGLKDIIVNSIWGKVIWYKNRGKKGRPEFAEAQAIQLTKPSAKPSWNWWNPEGHNLVTQWRTTPLAIDLNSDRLMDLVALDQEGYLAFYERKMLNGKRLLLPPRRIFKTQSGFSYDSGHRVKDKNLPVGSLLRLNTGRAGRSGRRKIALVDWNQDGKLDLLVNSTNAHLLLNRAEKKGEYLFEDMGKVHKLAVGSHTTSPCLVDWDGDGVKDLVLGAEDGHFYYLKR